MNNPIALLIALLASISLALTLAPELGVCVAEGDPLDGFVPKCPYH